MEEAATQEGIRQLFLVVRRDDDDGPVPGPDRLAGLVDEELHAIELLQEIVREFDIGLVDLVDQQDRPDIHGEGFPQLAPPDVVPDVFDALVAELAVAQTAHRVVFVEALLRLGSRFDVPLEYGNAEGLGDLDGKHRLAGAGLAFDEQRPLECDGGVDCDLEIDGGDIAFRALEPG